MITFAMKAGSHLAAWVLWQTMRVSLLEDLDAPADAPADAQADPPEPP
jgi:hypothetical protein